MLTLLRQRAFHYDVSNGRRIIARCFRGGDTKWRVFSSQYQLIPIGPHETAQDALLAYTQYVARNRKNGKPPKQSAPPKDHR